MKKLKIISTILLLIIIFFIVSPFIQLFLNYFGIELLIVLLIKVLEYLKKFIEFLIRECFKTLVGYKFMELFKKNPFKKKFKQSKKNNKNGDRTNKRSRKKRS